MPIYPGGQSAFRKEVQFRIASTGAWNPANDWSYTGVAATPGAAPVKANTILLYNNGVRVFGSEPGGGGSTPTATPTPASCSPRPNVGLTTTAVGDGRLQAVVSAGAAGITLQSLRFGAATNALIDAGEYRGQTGNFTVVLPAGTSQTTFWVRQASTSEAVTVPFVVVDTCGDWPTLVGGGPGVFATSVPTAGTTAVPTATASRTSTPTVAPTAGAGVGCQVTYTITNQWNTGFQGEATIRNNGAAINGWTLTWPFANGQTVTQSWNGNATQSGPTVQVTNASWNGSIPSGATASFGFLANHPGTNNAPSAFTLNGTACNQSTRQSRRRLLHHPPLRHRPPVSRRRRRRRHPYRPRRPRRRRSPQRLAPRCPPPPRVPAPPPGCACAIRRRHECPRQPGQAPFPGRERWIRQRVAKRVDRSLLVHDRRRPAAELLLRLRDTGLRQRYRALRAPQHAAPERRYLPGGRLRRRRGRPRPGGTSGEIQNRFSKQDWSNYDERNDYSFDPSKTTYQDWTRVTLYRNGVLVWGVEP